MNDSKKISLVRNYTQGICDDGGTILCNGVAMSLDEIVKALNVKQNTLSIVDSWCARTALITNDRGNYLMPKDIRLKITDARST